MSIILIKASRSGTSIMCPSTTTEGRDRVAIVTTKVSIAFSFMFPLISVLVTGRALKTLVHTGTLTVAVNGMVYYPLRFSSVATALRGI